MYIFYFPRYYCYSQRKQINVIQVQHFKFSNSFSALISSLSGIDKLAIVKDHDLKMNILYMRGDKTGDCKWIVMTVTKELHPICDLYVKQGQ